MRLRRGSGTVLTMSALPQRTGRMSGSQQVLLDGALCFIATAAALGPNIAQRGDINGKPLEHAVVQGGDLAIAIVLGLCAGLPIAVRRRFPLGVFAMVTAALCVHLILVFGEPGSFGPALVISLWTVATRCPRSVSVPAALIAAGLVVVILIGHVAAGHLSSGPDILFLLVLIGGSWAVGDNVSTRRAYLAGLVERAERLEREQEQSAQRAVLDERARIARELHDVVAHHVSAIAVQAGAAEEIAEQDPARARAVLAIIQATSRQALAEMRALVGVLHDGGEAERLTPPPGLAQVQRLAEQSRAAGLQVLVRVEGGVRPLPEAVDLTAYRIVQEALTNTLKHAGATRADVVVRYADGDVELVVTDDGSGSGNGAAMPGTGRGLVGMRERVALFHGTLDVGTQPGGGFRVHARLPTGEAAT
jgi:signal transduction histidine kinase